MVGARSPRDLPGCMGLGKRFGKGESNVGLVRRKGFALLFWVVAFLAGVAGLIYGGKAGYAAAPDFSTGSGASGASQIVTAVVGGLLGAAAVWAVFAGAWMALWALDRRAHPEFARDSDGYDSFDSLADAYDEADGEAGSAFEGYERDQGGRDGDDVFDTDDYDDASATQYRVAADGSPRS